MRTPSLFIAAVLTVFLVAFPASTTQANQKTTKLTLEILPALNEAPEVQEIVQGKTPGTVRLKISSRPSSRLKVSSQSDTPLFVNVDETGTAWVDMPITKPSELRIVEVNEADSTLSKEATVEVTEEFIVPAKDSSISSEAATSSTQPNEPAPEASSSSSSSGSSTLPILVIAALVIALTLRSLFPKKKPTHHSAHHPKHHTKPSHRH